MRKPTHVFSRRMNLSFKRVLTVLNRDLANLLRDLDSTARDDITWKHSIRERDVDLAPLVVCILALEDRRYFRHPGAEPIRALFRSARRVFSGKRMGGVSTIEQQSVRISRSRYERTLSRKVTETLLALIVNLHRSKSKILQYYIHNSYFGYRLEGCEKAANSVFGTRAADLEGMEAAIIASALARPIPQAIVQGMKQLPPSDRSAEKFFEISKAAHPSYHSIICKRATYCHNLLTDKFRRRLIK